MVTLKKTMDGFFSRLPGETAARLFSAAARPILGTMETSGALHNQLLIAMPGMADPNFSATVTLICEHNAEGALGIIINRPMELDLGGLFDELEVKARNPATARTKVLNGGPVGRERGFVLHNNGSDYESTVAVSADIRLTLSRDVLEAMAAGNGPEKSVVALGYAGWEAGQLEAEILANSWLNVPATPEIVFDVPFAERWQVATRSLGIDISQLSSDAGHA
ncbi:MAG: YqgE/AlgH family protein [Woeseiaceae bacterium]|nr:YqgE/AlgH family protein [Woeseiaceae bacterium]